MDSLAQKVALVTGVTRRQGIGAAVALALARAGADVGTAYYRPYDRAMPWGVKDSEPEEIVGELRAIGVRAHGFEIDLAQPDGPRRLFELAREQFGRIDILVNNAVYSTETTVDGISAVDLDRHYAVNLRAVMLLCVEFVRAFPAGNAGRIINLTSGQGMWPLPNELAYAATKGGVEAFTLSLSAAVTRSIKWPFESIKWPAYICYAYDGLKDLDRHSSSATNAAQKSRAASVPEGLQPFYRNSLANSANASGQLLK